MNGSWMSYLVCALMWIGCVYEILLVIIRVIRGNLQETPLIGSFFQGGASSDSIAPIIILVIFCWVLVEVFLHFMRAVREFLSVQQFESAADVTSGSMPISELEKIPANSRAGRRSSLFLQRLKPASLREAIPGLAALDASALDSSYSFIRVYVWILPVVGFIGTAWGMSHAIAGFSEALKETADIQVLTSRLSQLVIPGLANAFSITIMALSAAIIGHFCASVIQAVEHAALNQLDQACIRVLAKLPAGNDSNLADIGNVLQQMAARLGQAPGELTSAADALKRAAAELERTARAPYRVTITRGDAD